MHRRLFQMQMAKEQQRGDGSEAGDLTARQEG